VYLFSREEREKMHKLISEQLRKSYIRPSKLLQISLVFFYKKEEW